jgi:uncharacterized protein YukE
MFKQLKPEYQARLEHLRAEASSYARLLHHIGKEIASLNSPDKWVD